MGNNSSSVKYDEASDPCQPYMEAYLTCVKSHERGLSEGADCTSETIEYKKCRTLNGQKEKEKEKGKEKEKK